MSDESGTDNAEVIRIRASACQALVDQFVDGSFSTAEFIARLQETGATPDEALEYSPQARAHLDSVEDPPNPPPAPSRPGSRETTPDGLSETEINKFRFDRDALVAAKHAREEEQRRKAAAEVEWGVLRAKINSLFPTENSSRPSLTPAQLEQFLGLQLTQSTSPTSIPAATLSAAPHLARLSAGINADPHIEETWKYRRAFGADKALDPIVDVMQLQELVDPLPRSIWRSIIQDHYVDFEKVFAALSSGYDHQDDPKEFAGGFSLVKKDQTSAKRAIKSESDWIRVFAAWRAGVCLLYPHRAGELSGYLKVVTDLFRAAPTDPAIAIRFDVEARERYAKSPFHLDDRSQLNIALLSQMFRSSQSSGATVVCMVPVANAGNPIAPETTRNASLPSRLAAEKALAETIQRAHLAAQGPRPFPCSSGAKRTAQEAFTGPDDTHTPRFRRGFTWSSTPINNISPAARYTESALPLPSPPRHLVNSPVMQASLNAMKDHITKEKPRVITDHKSSGINDGIPKAEGHVRYDDMHDFGQALHDARLANPGREIVLFKSDVQGAFLNLPAHPLWQLHQVVEVDGVLQIRRPRRQVLLLILWEFVGCPSEDKKQEHGITLKIIGFWADAKLGSISLSPESVMDIIAKIDAFIFDETRQPTLREWQKLGGHLNWMLNVLPWAHPAL
ncbi:hypothetical protein DFH09DRAFT_922034, partial [Mycena vulgaris]